MRVVFWNCFWLILPLLAASTLFGVMVTAPGFFADDLVPMPILVGETVFRLGVFAAPFVLPIAFDGRAGIWGAALLLAGYVFYFAAWLPNLVSTNSLTAQSDLLTLAPFATPLFVFMGIALIGRSWRYLMVGVVFTIFHMLHGVFSFEII